jgi:NAD-dependent DNA ligase
MACLLHYHEPKHLTEHYSSSTTKHFNTELRAYVEAMKEVVNAMNTNRESRFRYLLVGLGLGAIGAILSALLARKETREYVREQGTKSFELLSAGRKKLLESAEGIAQKGRKLMSQHCSRCGAPADIATGDGKQEEKAEP